MKVHTPAPLEVGKTPDQKFVRKEISPETVVRARSALQKADAVLGSQPPRTAAERHLALQRDHLMTWLKRFGLMGAIVGGHMGLFAAAERAGDALHEGVVAVGGAIRSLGDIQPIRVEFGGVPEASTERGDAPVHEPAYVSWPEQGPVPAVIINDSSDPFAEPDAGPDATLSQESDDDRERRITNESAQLLVDQLETEGFFDQAHTPSGIEALLEARMREMGRTSPYDFEQARLVVRNRAHERVRDRADENIEEALRMADRVNDSMGGIDTYDLALRHHRPDLAAERASRSIAAFTRDVRDLGRDPEYADDPEGRTSILNQTRTGLLRDFFGGSHADDAPEVIRRLSRADQRELANAIDAEIASLESYATEMGGEGNIPQHVREELVRLRAQRALV